MWERTIALELHGEVAKAERSGRPSRADMHCNARLGCDDLRSAGGGRSRR